MSARQRCIQEEKAIDDYSEWFCPAGGGSTFGFWTILWISIEEDGVRCLFRKPWDGRELLNALEEIVNPVQPRRPS